MSGGYVKKGGLKKRQHQTVMFTFKGPTDPGDHDAWNEAIRLLKISFEANHHGCLIGVTFEVEDSPKKRVFANGPKALGRILKKYGRLRG